MRTALVLLTDGDKASSCRSTSGPFSSDAVIILRLRISFYKPIPCETCVRDIPAQTTVQRIVPYSPSVSITPDIINAPSTIA